MFLSQHFQQKEFEHETAIPDDCIPVLVRMCEDILEPTRVFVGAPLEITSGDRTVKGNALTHGVANSEHIFSPTHCAVDFTFNTSFGALRSVRMVFDWMRNNPSLPFHQLILEHGANGVSIIHVSIDLSKPGVRSVLEGATHNSAAYQAVQFVAYNPSSTENA